MIRKLPRHLKCDFFNFVISVKEKLVVLLIITPTFKKFIVKR